MYTSFFLIATAISYASATPSPQSTPIPTGPFFLGSSCSTSSQCPSDIQCYAVNSMLIPTCGNFQAACTSDAQCATNSCVSGFCNGSVAPTLPLGTMCYESAQCADGANCYAVNSMLIPRCGNFQATCSSDSQCAFNTCVNGFCSGILSSSSVSSTTSSTSTLTLASSNSTSAPTSSSSFTGVSNTTTFRVTSTTMTLTTALAYGTSASTSAIGGNSTITTATPTPTVFQGGAGKKLCAGFGGAVIASAISFALMIAI